MGILPLVKMYPVILIAALARSGDVRLRVAKGDDGVGHDGLRQAEQLFLGFHPIHLRPSAQPDSAKPQFLRSKAEVLGGNGSVDDPVILCKAERAVKVAADEDARSSVAPFWSEYEQTNGVGSRIAGAGSFYRSNRTGRRRTGSAAVTGWHKTA